MSTQHPASLCGRPVSTHVTVGRRWGCWATKEDSEQSSLPAPRAALCWGIGSSTRGSLTRNIMCYFSLEHHHSLSATAVPQDSSAPGPALSASMALNRVTPYPQEMLREPHRTACFMNRLHDPTVTEWFTFCCFPLCFPGPRALWFN